MKNVASLATATDKAFDKLQHIGNTEGPLKIGSGLYESIGGLVQKLSAVKAVADDIAAVSSSVETDV